MLPHFTGKNNTKIFVFLISAVNLILGFRIILHWCAFCVKLCKTFEESVWFPNIAAARAILRFLCNPFFKTQVVHFLTVKLTLLSG